MKVIQKNVNECGQVIEECTFKPQIEGSEDIGEN